MFLGAEPPASTSGTVQQYARHDAGVGYILWVWAPRRRSTNRVPNTRGGGHKDSRSGFPPDKQQPRKTPDPRRLPDRPPSYLPPTDHNLNQFTRYDTYSIYINIIELYQHYLFPAACRKLPSPYNSAAQVLSYIYKYYMRVLCQIPGAVWLLYNTYYDNIKYCCYAYYCDYNTPSQP